MLQHKKTKNKTPKSLTSLHFFCGCLILSSFFFILAFQRYHDLDDWASIKAFSRKKTCSLFIHLRFPHLSHLYCTDLLYLTVCVHACALLTLHKGCRSPHRFGHGWSTGRTGTGLVRDPNSRRQNTMGHTPCVPWLLRTRKENQCERAKIFNACRMVLWWWFDDLALVQMLIKKINKK